ncbi:MAG: hypothetical protein ACRDKS_01525, partial [Actinomycetota bacterium]
PPAPLVTRVMQILGLTAVAVGVWALVDGRDCEGLECLGNFLAVYLGVWGLFALLAGIRGPFGLVFLIGAILLALGVSWVEPFFGMIGLVVVLVLVRASKDRLAGYYRRAPKPEDA